MTGRLNKAFSIILMVVIVCTIGALVYVVTVPEVGETFTEFYLLGLEGKAEDYPEELVAGEEASVVVGIVNREGEDMSYWFEVVIDGERNKHVGPVELAYEEKWEQEVSFAPDRVGDDQKVEFLLYKMGESEPYLELYLWVDVKE